MIKTASADTNTKSMNSGLSKWLRKSSYVLTEFDLGAWMTIKIEPRIDIAIPIFHNVLKMEL